MTGLIEYQDKAGGLYSAVDTVLTISKQKEFPLNPVFRETLEDAARRFEAIR